MVALIIFGLFTRAAAFVLSGEMAVAYFTRWAPRGFWPISNGGEEAVLFCFIFFWLVFAGPGVWSLDQTFLKLRTSSNWLETYVRSVMRVLVAFTFTLHGCRLLFGVLPGMAGRQAAVPMALDALPHIFGALEIAGGLLLFFGLWARPTAIVLASELLFAYLFIAVPRSVWPIRNGGNEVLLYLLGFVFLAVAGAGKWSWDESAAVRSGRETALAHDR